jgi:glycerophosphoryl diester phosphodiesterase
MSPRPVLAALALLVVPPAGASPLEVQAHRGGAALRPENSLAAFREAIALGVDVLEMDLQLTRDGVLVVRHDVRLDGPDCLAPPSRAVTGPRITEMESSALEGVRCHGEPVPRFEDVLALVTETDAPVGLNVELKLKGVDAEALRPQLAWRTLAALERSGLADRAMIQSFDAEVLALVKSLRPEQSTGVLARDPDDYFERLERSGADALLPRADRLTAAAVAACRERGVRVIAWTVDDPGVVDRLADWGVDGVITDRPDRVLAHLGRQAAPRGAAEARVESAAPVAPAFALRDVRLAAVVPFTSRGRVDTFCTSLFQEAAREMKRTGFPRLIDLYELPVTIADGKPFQPRAALPRLLAAARDAGAEAIVVGEGNWYGPFGNRWRMELRLIEVNEGRVLWTTTGKSGPSISGPSAKREVVRECLRDFREEARGRRS